MTAVAHPDITCTKCDSVVPWGPHCPQCHAYLEFSGVPAWHPESELPAPEPEAAVEDTLAAGASDGTADGKGDDAAVGGPFDGSGSGDAAAPADGASDAEGSPAQTEPADDADSEAHDADPDVDADSSPDDLSMQVSVPGRHAAPRRERRAEKCAEGRAEKRREPRSFTLWQRGWRRQKRRNLFASVFAIALAVGLSFLFVAINGSLTALVAAPLLAVWAFLAVAFYGTIPDQREFEEQERLRPRPEPEPVVEVVTEVAVEEAPEPVDDDGIRSRAPQTVAETIEKSKPLIEHDAANRDQRCDACGHLNLRGHRYCEACTAVLGNSRVSPAVVAYTMLDEEGPNGDGGKAGGSGETKRRINGSWRNVVFALTILGVVVGAFAFAFFGPGAFRMQLGMTRMFQIVNQWIDPYAGRPAGITSVTASSSLPGTNPDSLRDADSRTFWASDVLPEFGTGSSITFTLEDPTEIDRMVIYPGIQNQLFDRRALATPRDITLTFDDGTKVKRTLNTLVSSNDFRQLVSFPRVTTTTVRMDIDTVYPPTEMDPTRQGEVAISGVQFLTVPAPPTLFRFQNGVRTPGLPGVESN